MKLYIKQLFFVMCILLCSNKSIAQTALTPGDIAFLSINSSGTVDKFSFVLLTPVLSSTQVHFTDRGWNEGIGFFDAPGDSLFTWTATSNLPAGTIVEVETFNGNQLPNPSVGTATGNHMLVSIAGDQLFAFQGTEQNPQFIAGISFNMSTLGQPGNEFDGAATSNATTGLPSALTIGVNALHVYDPVTFEQQNNSGYNGTITTGDKATILAALNNIDGWDTEPDVEVIIPPITIEVDLPTSVENSLAEVITVSPNPASEYFTIKGLDKVATVTVYDSTGKAVLNTQADSNTTIGVAHLPSETYVIEVALAAKSARYKLIIR